MENADEQAILLYPGKLSMTKYLGSRKKPETDLLQDTQEENASQEQTHRMVGGSALTMATETLIASKQADAHLFLQWRGLWP